MTEPLTEEHRVACQAFAGCGNAATAAAEHPALTAYLTCERCAERLGVETLPVDVERVGAELALTVRANQNLLTERQGASKIPRPATREPGANQRGGRNRDAQIRHDPAGSAREPAMGADEGLAAREPGGCACAAYPET